MQFGQEDCQLFVGDLSENVSEQLLFGEFSSFGKIESCKIMRHLATKKSRGYGFITFKTSRMAALAKEKMNGAIVMGQRIVVMLKGEHMNQDKDCMVVVCNIDPACTYEEFDTICKKYGPVRSLKYSPDINDTFTNRAVVYFENPEDAASCLAGLQGAKIKEKVVVPTLNNKNSKILVVKAELDNAKAEALRTKIENHCKQFGKIVTSNITTPASADRARFVCFVEFEDKKSVEDAINQAQQSINALGLKNGTFESYQEQQAHHHAGQQAASRSTTLILRPLRSDIRKDQVTDFFERYGHLKSVELSKLESDSNKEGWQVAKVVFDTTKALKQFYSDYEKDISILSTLASKGKEVDVQFPYTIIEDAKKKYHSSRYNKFGKGGRESGERGDRGDREHNGQRGEGGHRGGRGGTFHQANNHFVHAGAESQMNAMMTQFMQMQQMMQWQQMMGMQRMQGGQFPMMGMGVPAMGNPSMQVPGAMSSGLPNPQTLNPQQKKMWLMSQISGKVQQILATSQKLQYSQKVLDTLTDLEIFSEADQNKMLVDMPYLQSQVQEVIKVLEEEN